ncbi:MAG: Two-component system, OmpR family, phosphate regulon sensor histidine kinase PhoR [Gemmatimonadetes bacterium]|nr:Two-component system, OmpR family, phosphate regulon sensor histidine kinase PhoR [Gemmatimonadota bacterium]
MRLRADHKLFLTYLAVIAAVVAALTLGVRTTLRDHLMETVADDMRRETDLARALAATRPALAGDSMADWLGRLSGRRVTLVARDGRVLGDSEVHGAELARMENHAARPEVRAALEGRFGRDVRLSHTLGLEHMYVAGPGPHGEAIRLAIPLVRLNSALRSVQAGIFGVGLVALVLTGMLSFGFSVAVTRPLRQLASVARAMAGGDLTRRARARHRDELGELADALDTLAGELQRRLGQLEGERAEMQVLIDSMAEAVIAVGRDGVVRRANPAARRIFQLTGDPRGIAPEEVARRPAFLELVRRALGGDAVLPTELSDGDRHLLATAQPLPGGGAVMVFLDVSELRRLEDVRRDFVANASHELKTPLTAIRGFSETLLDPHLPGDLRTRFAATVKDNADRLQRIIDDLLDLSRIESGGYRVRPEIVSVPDAAAEAWAPFADEGARKEARFSADVPAECEYVWADPGAVRQILSNLFGNALRYVPAGGSIEVSARCVPGPMLRGPQPARETRAWVAVAVADTGSGIPAAHLPRIFERFYRADAARSRAEGGTGLGLSIVRHLVERHGGSIEAESTLGRGTTIRFTLPMPEEHDAADAEGDAV